MTNSTLSRYDGAAAFLGDSEGMISRWKLARGFGAVAAALALWLAFAGTAFAADPPERRVALVIGNAAYVNVAHLSNTIHDAQLMADTLRKLGFQLVGGGPQLDLDRNGFLNAVVSFSKALDSNTVGVFYYSGHGMQIQGENYLVPVDANPVKPSDADIQLVASSLVLHQMEDSKLKLNIVILDACRNNPFAVSGLRAAGGGLGAITDEPEGTLISYATMPGSVASDGEGAPDSPYTTALAQMMQRPGIDAWQMFNAVSVQVKRATNGVQQPYIENSPIEYEFYFNGSPGSGSPSFVASAQPQPQPYVAPLPSPPPQSPVASLSPSPSPPVRVASVPPLQEQKSSSIWRGVYYYPDSRMQPVPFEMRLQNVDGRLSGSIKEPKTFSRDASCSSNSLYASVVGQTDGSSIVFTKTYDSTCGVSHAVRYAGTVNSNGSKVTGQWSAGWTGSFTLELEN